MEPAESRAMEENLPTSNVEGVEARSTREVQVIEASTRTTATEVIQQTIAMTVNMLDQQVLNHCFFIVLTTVQPDPVEDGKQ